MQAKEKQKIEATDSGERKQTFFREVAVDQVGLLARRFFTTNFGWKCPACEQGSVHKGLFSVKNKCPVCGSVYTRLEGNELITIALNFFIVCIVLFAVGLPLFMNVGFFDGATLFMLGLGLLTLLLFWKPVRVLSLWLLWMIGFVFPDRVPKGKTVAPLRDPAASEDDGDRGGERAGSGRYAGQTS